MWWYIYRCAIVHWSQTLLLINSMNNTPITLEKRERRKVEDLQKQKQREAEAESRRLEKAGISKRVEKETTRKN